MTHFSSLLRWINENQPRWSNHVIKEWYGVFPRAWEQKHLDVLRFVTRREFVADTCIDMQSVVGQDRHYAGQTWLNALVQPQYKPWRMESVIDWYNRNPEYYVSKDRKSTMGFDSVDGRTWYCSEGNHRTVLAKFALAMRLATANRPPLLHGVYRCKYSVDWLCFAAYKELSQRIADERLDIRLDMEHILIKETGPFEESVSTYENRYWVVDFRYPEPRPRAWITSSQFLRFAEMSIANDGKLSLSDRLWHFFLTAGRETAYMRINRLRGIC